MILLKLSGAAMVLTGAAIYALWGLLLLKQRLDALKQLTRAVIYIMSGIEFSQKTMPQIFKELAVRNEGTVSVIFAETAEGLEHRQTCAELWDKAIDKMPFTREEREIFRPLGACLGMTDKSVQLKTAEMLVNDAREYEKRLCGRIEHYKAVDMRLRVMCGVVAVVILI